MRRSHRRAAVLAVVGLVLLAVGYYTVSGFLAYRDLSATRTALLTARDIGSTAPARPSSPCRTRPPPPVRPPTASTARCGQPWPPSP